MATLFVTVEPNRNSRGGEASRPGPQKYADHAVPGGARAPIDFVDMTESVRADADFFQAIMWVREQRAAGKLPN